MVKAQGRYSALPTSENDVEKQKENKPPKDDSGSEKQVDESTETRLLSIAIVLVIHFFSNAMTIPLLPSLLLHIFEGMWGCYFVLFLHCVMIYPPTARSHACVTLSMVIGDRAATARCSGWLNALKNLLTFLMMPLWGTLGDVVGRKVTSRECVGLFAFVSSSIYII
jgi:MFS family permease